MRACLILLFGIAVSAALIDQQTKEEFELFLRKHGKHHNHPAEYAKRLSIFAKNRLRSVEHNLKYANGTVGWAAGITRFSDLTREEFKMLYTGSLPNFDSAHSTPFDEFHGKSAKRGTVDWRARGLVSTVKDQEQCGSCWSFATTAVVETCVGISTGQMYNASAYNLQDCAGHGWCQGLKPDVALKYVQKNGVFLTEDYPFAQGSCQVKHTARLFLNSTVKGSSEDELETLLQSGAVGVLIQADPLQLYRGGVITAPIAYSLDHAVVVVGLTTNCDGKSDQCWIVKNSWGTRWGERGYFRVARGIASMGLGPQGIFLPTGCSVQKTPSL
ncbi:hypothetical protein PROFUN_10715 [Planoprotostelium fungivorum]|uniref:Uncharacterized protein n=1 Tax=Planoprotostelium fungivorum TaxID=1890364 RepID=A0A2P6N9Q1_9EUKA|nr:hypothetical protein PROFUN_10715 [Planoprotostelium fungivorum]